MTDEQRAELIKLFRALENARLELENFLTDFEDDELGEDLEFARDIVEFEITSKIEEAGNLLTIGESEYL